MTYTYRNKKTCEEIVTSNKVTGKNWEPVEEENLYSAEGMEDGYEDVFDEDPAEEAGEGVPVEEAPAEEAPAPKPKASRKGKK